MTRILFIFFLMAGLLALPDGLTGQDTKKKYRYKKAQPIYHQVYRQRKYRYVYKRALPIKKPPPIIYAHPPHRSIQYKKFTYAKAPGKTARVNNNGQPHQGRYIEKDGSRDIRQNGLERDVRLNEDIKWIKTEITLIKVELKRLSREIELANVQRRQDNELKMPATGDANHVLKMRRLKKELIELKVLLNELRKVYE
jgi:hypothetical protein